MLNRNNENRILGKWNRKFTADNSYMDNLKEQQLQKGSVSKNHIHLK